MRNDIGQPAARTPAILFNVLDPIPYGCFVGALIFDAVYAGSGDILWVKAAAWLIAIGLLFAVVPRFINLARVLFPGHRLRVRGEVADFGLNLVAIVAAITNAFVHSRDAYGVMPAGLLLSCLTIVLLVLSRLMPMLQRPRAGA